jgi:NAD(P)H-dependent FMN reductase
MAAESIRLAVIIGSVRGGRLGPTVANWLAAQARQFGQFDVDVIDLAEADLPVVLPAYAADPPRDVTARLASLTRRLDAADAFVVVTPEYNHSFPASLKSAIDWHNKEWHAKPVGLVSYGGLSGGLRAAEHLRQVFAEVHAVAIRDTVSFHEAGGLWDADGHWPKDTAGGNAAAKVMLSQLTWWAWALREAKAKRPFPA